MDEVVTEVLATRRAMLAEAAGEDRDDVARVEDVDAGGVPARVYAPDGAVRTVLFAHGGGFVFGEPDTHDAFTRRLATTTGSAVVLVDYRRAPEDPYPAAVDDVRRAHDWLRTRDDLPGEHVALGDSAGANLVLGLALRRPDAFAALVLVYPFLDPSLATYDPSRDTDDFSTADARWFWNLYAPDESTWTQQDLDPLVAPSFAGLPRTLLQQAGLDPLHPVGDVLAARLRADGVAVTKTTYGRVPHGFWRKAAHPESFAAVAEIATFLAS